MNIYFISDLHLQESNPHLTQLFLNFLQESAGKIQALYILGDFFNYWIGDDDANVFHQKIISALATFAKQTPLYFMHGNRDFLIGKRFSKQTNCQLLPDPSIIDLFGRATLITHGDSLCTRDRTHMRMRKILRNVYCQKLFLALPIGIRKRIAIRMRKRSIKHTQALNSALMDIPTTEIQKLLQQYQVNQIIHGHTHKPVIEHLKIDNTKDGDNHHELARRIVLSDWGKQGNALIYKPDGEVELVYF